MKNTPTELVFFHFTETQPVPLITHQQSVKALFSLVYDQAMFGDNGHCIAWETLKKLKCWWVPKTSFLVFTLDLWPCFLVELFLPCILGFPNPQSLSLWAWKQKFFEYITSYNCRKDNTHSPLSSWLWKKLHSLLATGLSHILHPLGHHLKLACCFLLFVKQINHQQIT